MVDQHQRLARQLWRALIRIADETTLDEVPAEAKIETLQLIAIEAMSTNGPLAQPVGYVGKTSLKMLLAGENSGCVLSRTQDAGIGYVALYDHSPTPVSSPGLYERRYKALCDWYIRGAPRSEIHEHGHIEFTTQAHIDAWADTILRHALAPCETIGAEDLESGCCTPCRARAALSATAMEGE